MRRKNYLLVIIAVFMLGICSVKAEVCDEEDIAIAKELAKNINVNYEYSGNLEEGTQLQQYSVWFEFNGLDGKAIARDVNKGSTAYFTGERLSLRSGKYKFEIYYTVCLNKKVGEVSFNLKKFNVYSLREECSDLKGKLAVCDSWNQEEIDDVSFKKEIDGYNKDNSVSVNNLISKYFIFIVIGGVLLVLVIILLLIRHFKHNRLD